MKKIEKLNKSRVIFICLFAVATLLGAYEYARLRTGEIHAQKAAQAHTAHPNAITKEVGNDK